MRKWPVLVAITILCGCGESDTVAPARITTVHPGESIQAAINAAPPHAAIFVAPGVYHESLTQPSAVVISKDDISLIGMSTPGNPVVLENSGGQKNGIWVSPTDSVNASDGEHPPCGENGQLVQGFQLQGFTVRGFDQYGVYLGCVDGFTLTGNVADANQYYGLFPVRSHHGTMSNNEAANTQLDSALYVGQSDNVMIIGNSAHDNIQGLEIENSTNITCTQNQVFHNTAGIIADINTGLQKTDQTDVLIADNDVHDNNRANTAGEGETTSMTPQGTGIVILGGSRVTVQHNTLTNNGFTGIIVAGFCSGPSSQCTNLDIDPNPEDNRIVNNILNSNGLSPPNNPLLMELAADLIWDSTGTGNCWAGNTPSATVKILGSGHTLPACP
jgi:parallel beta-helix repeat protein